MIRWLKVDRLLGHRKNFNRSEDGIAAQTVWALTVVSAANSTVLSCRFNMGSDCSDVTVSGREF